MNAVRPPDSASGDDAAAGDRALAEALRIALRESEALDATTAGRLRAARRRALDVASPPQRSLGRAPMLWGAGALATAAVLAMLMVAPGWRQPPEQRLAEPVPMQASTEAFDVMTDELDDEFYEDLDLYRWLADDSAAAGSPSA